MGGARALIASFGAGISLVAGAALALLFVSFVFAYDGFVGGSEAPTPSAALVLEARSPAALPSRGGGAREESRAVVIKPVPRARIAARPATRRPRPGSGGSAPGEPSFQPDLRDLTPAAPAPAAAPPASIEPAPGDGVRDVGEAVSATVQGTGQATAPLLGPPVSTAVQDVLDLLTRVLQGATGALAGVVDKALPPPR